MKTLIIYNLFPRLFNNSKEWINNLDRIYEMGFNAVFINPFHSPGFSGSLYAVKDYYSYNKLFFTDDKPAEEHLKDFIVNCKNRGLDVFMDLILNHTSKDSVLVSKHKNWFLSDDNGELISPSAWQDGEEIIWGDLAELDLENSPDRDDLWEYLYNVCRHYLFLGFTGFRCDAAYQITSEFWSFLISELKKDFPDTYFLAETLGCTPVQIQSLSSCGFDYIFNSSKWWNFDDDWCLEQYDMNREIAPSISFPESHDTDRLLNECKNNKIHFLQRLYFSSVFSKGLLIPAGFEFGFKKRISVVDTTPEDWENTGIDFSDKIKNIISIKKSLSPIHEESFMEVIAQPNNIFCFVKEWQEERVLICINKDLKNEQKLDIGDLSDLLKAEKIKDYSPEKRIEGYCNSLDIILNPGEVKIFASELHFKKRTKNKGKKE